MSEEENMKRETLTRNLKEMIERAKNTFLPVSIVKIFVHGSYLRGDPLPGDLDVIILGNVKEQWSQWHEDFSSLRDCHSLIVDCYEKGMSVEDAFRGPLASEIEKRNIPIDWIATMSWSELFGRTTFNIPYMLFWDRITDSLLTKGMKGIHIQFEMKSEAFVPLLGRLHICQEIPLFAIWSSESPMDYVLEPTKIEYEGYLKLEYETLNASLSDALVLKKIGEFLINASLSVISKEELGMVAIQVLWNTPKYEVSEKKLRETLRKFGIPENRVYAIKYRGSKTSYELARNEEEELELKAKAEEREKINAAELAIQKILRKVVSRDEAKVDCQIWNPEKGTVSIHATKPAAMIKENFREMWEGRGFRIEDYGVMCATKSVRLSLGSNIEKLSSEIKQCLEVTK
jgi:hypothetical protein